MNYLICAAARYGSTSILERVHKAFFNYYQFDAMTYLQDEIILANDDYPRLGIQKSFTLP